MPVAFLLLALSCAGSRKTERRQRRNGPGVPLHSVQPMSGLVAQSVEQRPFKPLVAGSSPAQPTTFFASETRLEPCKYAGLCTSADPCFQSNAVQPSATICQEKQPLANLWQISSTNRPQRETATWAANSPNVIHRHYKALVKEAAAKEFREITPCRPPPHPGSASHVGSLASQRHNSHG